jgi:acetolactate synthase-1/2/3 large subunit
VRVAQQTGADVLAAALRAAGVETLFNLSGNQIMPLYSPLVDAGVSLVHTRHEASAVHMADAYARLTERPCPVLVTAGPGHTNALTATYVARQAESPVVLLSGHAELANQGLGAFQEMDQVGLARRVAKAAWLATDPARLGDDLARAYRLANSGRPGPVHISLPADVLRAAASARPPPAGAFQSRRPAVPGASVAELVRLVGAARRPLLLAGPAMARGRRWAAARALADALGAPALPMESPRGANDPSLGGVRAAFPRADLVVLLGRTADFSLGFGRPPLFAPDVRLVAVGAGVARPDLPIALSIPADPVAVAAAARDRAPARPPVDPAWRAEVEEATRLGRAAWPALVSGSDRPMHPLRLVAAAARHLSDDDVFVGDGGEFGQWAQAGLAFLGRRPDRVLNGPSGAIGPSIPFAIGARLARPSARVVAFLGDGTAAYHLTELDTAVRHRLAFLAVVGDDGQWNAEVQIQRGLGGAPLACLEIGGARYDRAAEALGAHARRVDDPADLDEALAGALAADRPALLDVGIRGEPAPTYQPGH